MSTLLEDLKTEQLRRQKAAETEEEEEETPVEPAEPPAVVAPPEERPLKAQLEEARELLREQQAKAAEDAEALGQPVVSPDYRSAQDTVKLLKDAVEEQALPRDDREVARFDRTARASDPSVWNEQTTKLGQALDVDPQAFGSPTAPGAEALEKALQAAQSDPDNPDVREAMKYFANDLKLFGDAGVVTDRNYAEKLPQLVPNDRSDLEHTLARRQMGERTPVVGTTPRSGAVAILQGKEADTEYASQLRRLTDRASRVSDAGEFNRLAKDFPNLLSKVALINKFTAGDTEQAKRAILHGEMARNFQERFGQEGVPVDYIPMMDAYGVSLDYDTYKLAAYVDRYLELQEQGVENPEPSDIVEEYAERLQELEQQFLNAGVPVYNADPTKMTAALLDVSAPADEDTPVPDTMAGLVTFAAKEFAKDYLPVRTSGSPFQRAKAAVLQQLTPAEYRSGYITINNKQIRVAQDRFVESVAGRSPVSSSADYLLQVASPELVAKPYVLMLDRLRREHPDEPIDGLAVRHPAKASFYYYKYLGSDQAVLDRAVTDAQLAEMMVTIGRVGSPAIPLMRSIAGDPEDMEEGLARSLTEMAETAIAGGTAVGGAAATFVALAKDPLDGTNALIMGLGKGARGIRDSRLVKQALTPMNAATEAMERSTNQGIQDAFAALATTDEGKEARRELFLFLSDDVGRLMDLNESPTGTKILEAAIDTDTRLAQRGKDAFVVDTLLKEAGNHSTAKGLEAVILAASAETAGRLSGRVSDTAPARRAAGEAERTAAKARDRMESLADKARDAVSDVEFNKARRDSYDAKLEEFKQAVLVEGDARITIRALNDRIRAIENQALGEVAIANRVKKVVDPDTRDQALELLLTALGKVRKGERLPAKMSDELRIYINPLREGEDLVTALKRLQAGSASDQELAVRIRDAFFDYYEDTVRGNLVLGMADIPEVIADAKQATLAGIVADVAGARKVDLDALKERRLQTARELSAARRRVAEARKALDEAADAVLELSPRSTKRKMGADARRAAREGSPVEPTVKGVLGQDAELTKGIPIQRAKKVKGEQAAPAPTFSEYRGPSAKDAEGRTVVGPSALRTNRRAKLAALFDDMQELPDLTRRQAQERLAKRTAKEAGAKKRTTKKSAEDLAEQYDAKLGTFSSRVGIAQRLARTERLARNANNEALLNLFRTLEETAALRASRRADRADVAVVLDAYRRGKYGPRSLADVLESEFKKTAASQSLLSNFWRRATAGDIETALPVEGAGENYQRLVNAARFWFDPAGAAGRAQREYKEARDAMVAGRTRYIELAGSVLKATVNRYARARFVNDVYALFGEVAPAAAGTDVAKAVARVNQEAARRQEIVDADLTNIDRAVEIIARQRGLSGDESLDLLAETQRAYLTRDYEAMQASPVFDIRQRVVGPQEQVQQDSAFGVYIKGLTELAEGSAGPVATAATQAAKQVVVGATDKVARGLSRTTSATVDVIEHLQGVRTALRSRKAVPSNLTDLDVGQFIITLVKSQIKEGQFGAAGPAIDAFCQRLAGKATATKPGLEADDVLFTGSTPERYDRLYELVRDAVGPSGTVVGPRSQAEFARIIADGSVYSRAFKDLLLAQVGVTAADASTALKALSRGAAKEQLPYLNADLFKLRGPSEMVPGSKVYLRGELKTASDAAQPFMPTEAIDYDPATGQRLKTRTRRAPSVFAPDEIPLVGTKGQIDVVDPHFSGARSYTYQGLDPDDKTGKTALVLMGNGTRKVPLADLQPVPEFLRAGDIMESLAKLGVVDPLAAKELSDGMQRLVLIGTRGDADVPVYLVKQQVDYISSRLRRLERNFKDVTQEEKAWTDPTMIGGNLFRAASAFIASKILYGTTIAGFGNSIHTSARALRSVLDDTLATAQTEGNAAAFAVLVAGLRTTNRAIEQGRILGPAGLPFVPFGPARLGALLLRKAATSADTARIANVLPIPDDLTLLLDGPLRYLEDTAPNQVFNYRGKTLKRPDGTDMTVGEVYEELESAGVYDTFHSRARDALLLNETRRLRLRTDASDARGFRAQFTELLARFGVKLPDMRGVLDVMDTNAQQLADVTNEVGTEQRAALYLYKRFRGSTATEAEDAMTLSLMNWTDLSPVARSVANVLVLYGRAKYQGWKQSGRVWARALGGDTDAVSAFVLHSKLRERVLPYVGETYMGTDAPSEEAGEQARRNYYTTLRLLRQYRQDWEEPYAYVVSRPYSPEEKERIDALAPGLSNRGYNLRLLTRGNYDDMVLPYQLGDLAVQLAVSLANLGVDTGYRTQPAPSFDAFIEGSLETIHDELNPFTGAILDTMAGKRSYGAYSKPGLQGYDVLLSDLGFIATEEKRPKGQPKGVTALKTVPSWPAFFSPFTRLYYRDGAKTYVAMQQTEMFLNLLAGNTSISENSPGALVINMMSPEAAAAYRKGPKEYMEDGRHRDELASAYLRYLSLYARTNRALMLRTREMREDSLQYEMDLRKAHVQAIRDALIDANSKRMKKQADQEPEPE